MGIVSTIYLFWIINYFNLISPSFWWMVTDMSAYYLCIFVSDLVTYILRTSFYCKQVTAFWPEWLLYSFELLLEVSCDRITIFIQNDRNFSEYWRLNLPFAVSFLEWKVQSLVMCCMYGGCSVNQLVLLINRLTLFYEMMRLQHYYKC